MVGGGRVEQQQVDRSLSRGESLHVICSADFREDHETLCYVGGAERE